MRKRKMFQSGWDLPVIILAALLYIVSVAAALSFFTIDSDFLLPLTALAGILFPLSILVYFISRRRAERLWRRWLLGGIAVNMGVLAYFLWLFTQPMA